MDKLLKLHPSRSNPITISDLDAVVNNRQDLIIEDKLLNLPCIQTALNNNFLVLIGDIDRESDRLNNPDYKVTEYPDYKLLSSKKSAPTYRDSKWIEERAIYLEKIKQLCEEAEKQLCEEKAEKQLYQDIEKELGIKRSRCSFVKEVNNVCCRLGYGIVLDTPGDDLDISEFVWNLVFESDFLNYAKNNKVYVTKYIIEDTTQIWLVDASSYTETSTCELGKNLPSGSDNGLLNVYNKIKHSVYKQFNVELEELDPEWMMHLYYE